MLIIHGGEEFSDLPLPYVRKFYHKLLSLGADIIVGHHPHVPQNYEIIGNKVIFYSLGNFIFDTDYQRHFSHTDNCVLLTIHFSKTSFNFEGKGCWIDRSRNVVEASSLPSIFCNISKIEYWRYFSYSMRYFYRINAKKNEILSPRIHNMSTYRKLLHNIYVIRYQKERSILIGMLLSFVLQPNNNSNTSLITYLSEASYIGTNELIGHTDT